MDTTLFPSKTLALADLRDPPLARVDKNLRRFALQLGAKNIPFAVNGILKRRFFVRRHKMWEYVRAVACVLAKKEARRGGPMAEAPPAVIGEAKERRKFRVLDFGGGGTLPIFYLAQQECEVWCLDVDPTLAQWTNKVAWKKSWRLRALTHDLTRDPAPPDWGKFDAVISCSVLEHIPKASQKLIFQRLSDLLKPTGLFLFSFDYGTAAPVPDAVRSQAEVQALAAASGLESLSGEDFADSGERFALDKRHPKKKFTFASLFLRKPAPR